MAGTAPDGTALFETYSPCADDDQIRTLLTTATGKDLRVGMEHWLAKSAARTPLLVRKTQTEVYVGWEMTSWALLHVVDVTALADIPVGWILRPSFMSQALMDLLTAGGLQAFDAAHEGDVVGALVKAAKTVPVIKATPDDVVMLERTTTGTWLEHALTGSFISRDGKGRAYAQMRSVFGGWYTAADATSVKNVLEQVPYTFLTLVGDIQGLPNVSKAQMIGAAFVKTEIPDHLDFLGPLNGGMVEIYRRAGPDPFDYIFDKRWRTAYPSLARLCHALGIDSPLTASSKEARDALLAASLAAGYGSAFSPELANAVEQLLAAQVDLVDVPANKDRPAMDRVLEAARMATRLSKSGLGHTAASSGPSDTTSAFVESSDDKWAEAAKDPYTQLLLNDLAALHTVPVDAKAAARVLLKADSPVGLIFLNGQRVPDVKVLKDMVAARSSSALQSVLCEDLSFDRAGVAQPAWGALIDLEVCVAFFRCKWIGFDVLTKAKVVCSSASIDWWRKLVRPIVAMEDGELSAKGLSPSSPDALSLFADSRRLQRGMPILKRAFACMGVSP